VRLASPALLRTESDERLIALTREGNEQAFAAIVERYRRPLLRHGRRLLTDAGADDAVQQAFLSAWTALLRGDDVRELSPWLHRILRNVALNALRGAPRESQAELPDTLTSGRAPEDELERRMAVRDTLANVAALPERQRKALLRTAVEGRSQDEVARSLGLSAGAVAQLVMRGRRTLRAAASSLTPPWLVDWLSALGTGGAGGGASAIKVAAVIVVAGTAAAEPALVDHRAARSAQVAEAKAAPQRPARAGRVAADPPLRAVVSPVQVAGRGGAGSRGHGSGRGEAQRDHASRGSGPSGQRASGSGSRGSGHAGSGSGSSGSGSSGSGSSGSGSSGSGSSGSGFSGSGSGPAASSSGSSGSSGSGGSGSGSSGSGDSGSGSGGSSGSGSGSSGSGSGSSGSGSGSSGSGTSGSEAVEAAPIAPALTGTGSSGPGSGGSSGSGSGAAPIPAPADSGSSGPGSGDEALIDSSGSGSGQSD
jgi:RNA polymerase sigma factor (sigma-70 family)